MSPRCIKQVFFAHRHHVGWSAAIFFTSKQLDIHQVKVTDALGWSTNSERRAA